MKFYAQLLSKQPAYLTKQCLRIMKITAILMTTILLQVSAIGHAQKISLSKNNATLIEIFKEIQLQSGYGFVYTNPIIRNAKRVSIQVKDMALAEVLEKCFEGQPLTFSMENKTIILKQKKTVTGLPLPPISVKGTVTDEKGQGIPGVNVTIRGTSNNVITDKNGSYQISMNDAEVVLVFSYVGYATQEVKIGNQREVDVMLKESTQSFNEVVVVGYGTQKKANLTGAISVVDTKLLENRPVTNALAALQGAASGITVTRANGQPGREGYGMQIRGLSSVNGSSPLYIVDGVPGEITTLNPNDMASITILKDAAAAAIYGARAAGGVVLVTTKNGKTGKTVVNYNGMYGLQRTIAMPDRLHSWEEYEFANLAFVNAGLSPGATDQTIAFAKDPNFNYRVSPTNPQVYEYYYDVNMVDELVRRTTPTQQHNLSISGGTDKSKYFMSLGYYDQQGMFKVGPDDSKRINARLNYSTKFNDIFSADIRLSYTNSHTLSPYYEVNGNNTGNNNILYLMYKIRSVYPVFLPGSNDTKYPNGGLSPYGLLKEGGKNDFTQHDINPVASIKAENLVKGLTLRAVYAPGLLFSQQDAYKRTIPLWNVNAIGTYINNPNGYTDSYVLQVQNNAQFLADYDFKINDKNTFHILGGTSYEDYNFRNTIATANALSSNELFTLNLGDPKQASNSQNIQTWGLLSYFGRVNYNFDERFLFEANLRYDGSSKLAPSNRWHAFPSVSGAWRINNEKWFKSAAFDDLKIRGSWGQLGNSNGVIGNYDYIALIKAGSVYPFNNQLNNAYFQNDLASPDKTWETIETSNIGLDATVLKGRLTVSGDYYIKRNKDMLAPLQVSSAIGVTPSTYNVADLKTWGWEINVQWKDKLGTDFSYFVNANLSDNKNKILKYNGQSTVQSGLNSIIEGMPFNTIYGYQAQGYFQNAGDLVGHAFQDNKTGVGDIKYQDINGDGVISSGLGRLNDHGDLVNLGSSEPRYSYGINLGFDYKGFDFSAFFQGVGKRNILLDPNAVLPLLESWLTPLKDNLDYWTPDNPNARYPRPYLKGTQNSVQSSHWLANAAYIRLKNLQIGYTLPASFGKKTNINKVRVYFSGQDLWETTKMWNKNYDPESPFSANYVYPLFRNYTLGLSVTF
jgi:TonB-linked SusC/RagA family outer membrane protein